MVVRSARNVLSEANFIKVRCQWGPRKQAEVSTGFERAKGNWSWTVLTLVT